jgi:hypothetical protein
MTEPASLVDAFDHAIRAGELTPHQRAAVSQLDSELTPEQRQAFTAGWRATGSPAAARPLAVPYYAQNDSDTGQGMRMCFSSTCAMAAMFLRPGCLVGPNAQPDDEYLALLERLGGDTTDAEAQVRTLAHLKIKATFRQDGNLEAIARKLAQGIPVPVGWLHRGPVGSPSGGGHWTLAIGWDPVARQVIMHDPNGEADLVRGGYVATAVGTGRGVRYSAENWGRRWMAGPASSYRFTPGTGWWLDLARA